MTFDPTKPVQTRDGRPARIICTDRDHIDGSIVALVTMDTPGHEGEEIIRSFHKHGGWLLVGKRPNDLVNVPVKTSTWQSTYAQFSSNMTHPSKESCVKTNSIGLVGHLRRDFENGMFVRAEFEPLET